MKNLGRCLIVGILILAGCGKIPGMISGVVVDHQGPIEGATVRIQTTDIFTETNELGQFDLIDIDSEDPVRLTAWAEGYFIVASDELVSPGESDILLTLIPHAADDFPGYQWVSAFAEAGEEGNCENCHASADGSESSLPFEEWIVDAHAGSSRNQRFLTMYAGTDLEGNKSPLTRKGSSRDYGTFPLAPDYSLPYFGPGYQLDFPDTAGNCAACHAPAAAINAPYGTDPTTITGVGTEGVGCDFCHKVWGVHLDPDGMPYPNMPGVLSFEFRRPHEGHQFFAGPYDDVAPGEDTYSPLQQQSEFCAPCHFATFWDTTVYNSFGEWLESPYSDPATGQTCQDCHMPVGLTDHFAVIEKGGNIRDQDTIFSHLMLGITDENFMQNSVSLRLDAARETDQVSVRVEIINDNTGHHIPTDSPLRNMILLVQVTDVEGNYLKLVEGPTVPEWGGVGDPSRGYYAGLPGMGYAKILEELWTEVSPTGAYWNQTRVVSDNRISAMGSKTSNYLFEASADEVVTVEIRLIYRRAFIELVDQKGWQLSDLEIANQSLVLEPDE